MMKSKGNSRSAKGVVKGAPSGFVISLLVHVAAFLLAGMLVVFTVAQKEEKKFIPPKPVDRPKMKLKKPKVKVKKTAKPKATTRIVTKVKKASMPDIRLPEMSGIGDGLAGDIGGFDLTPGLGEVTVFGSGQTIGNDLVGTFYDTKRDRSGRPISYSQEGFEQICYRFVKSGFRPSTLSRYYRSPNKRYATSIMMPPMLSAFAPTAFDEPDTVGCLFMIHYEGQLVHKDGIKFRFWGESGDVLFVAIDGKVVLDACYPGERQIYPQWNSDSSDHRRYQLGYREAAVGNLVELEPGVPHKLDILVGESPGGGFGAYLLVEEEGVDYGRNYEGTPLLPIFKTAQVTLDQVDAMYEFLVPNEVMVTNGPVFCDFEVPEFSMPVISPEADAVPVEPAALDSGPLRVWSLDNGKTFEAEFVITMADNAVLKDARGRQNKVPLKQLSEEDLEFISLNYPPDFTFNFGKKTTMQPPIDPGPFMDHVAVQQLTDFEFTATVKQKSTGDYPHELTAEYFAFGEEVDGDNYVFLDHQTSTFTLTKENRKTHSFTGPKVTTQNNEDYYRNRRGVKYGGYAILLKDKRGKVIAHKASHKWLMDNLENLRKVPLGRHFDKKGNRCFPPRQKPRPRN